MATLKTGYHHGDLRTALIDAGLGAPDGIRELPAWDAETALKTMDKLQVGTAMLSISSPGVHLGDDKQASHLARRVNEEAQRLRHTYPDRFGHLASLPLPNVEDAVAEAIYAFDVLGDYHANAGAHFRIGRLLAA